MQPLQWLLSLIFVVQMYLAMLVMGLFYFPLTFISRDWAVRAVHAYTRWVRWTLRVICGLRTEVRGTPPTDEVLIAAKHQSFLDIILIVDSCPRPKFIMKAELKWAPILGWYALRIGCVPVDRGKRAQAIDAMKKGVAEGRADPGQLVIYPQGTRIAPGVKAPYKIGAGVLYTQLGQPCVPVAANVGVFWAKRGIYRRRGAAVIEYLPRVAPGLTGPQFMKEIEARIEEQSDRLIDEARRGDR